MDLDDIYDAITAAGMTKVVAEYSGENDEGYFNEITSEPEGIGLDRELEQNLEGAAYEVLESRHAGWEINEGSSGQVIFDAVGRKAFIHHGENVVTQRWFDSEV